MAGVFHHSRHAQVVAQARHPLDGQGNLFNLIAASWFIASLLSAGLIALGVPPLLTLPLWLYSVWVGANALSGAIPRASLGYSIAGIVISLIPAMLAIGVVFVALGIALAMLGVIAPPASAGPQSLG
jgi:small-conductance mechanosensitive channel